jgi:hypothetical protein
MVNNDVTTPRQHVAPYIINYVGVFYRFNNCPTVMSDAGGVMNAARHRQIIVGLICLSALVTWGGSMLAENVYRLFKPYSDYEVSGPVTISSEWLEITPEKPLRTGRQIHLIVIELDAAIKIERDGWGLILPDGSVSKAEVQLVDQDGKIYYLDHPAVWQDPSTGTTLREFSSPDLPENKVYRAVRIRADKPIRCNRVFWRNYNQWDVS